VSLQHLERRFGIAAVKKGFITADQLIEAQSTQILEELKMSRHRLIGQILLEKQYLTAVQIKQVLKSLGISEDFVARVQKAAALYGNRRGEGL
jgi:plasmid maintenance system antidote protein VapI